MPTRDSAWPQGTPCWVDCSVDDPAAARIFYHRLLGWDAVDGPPEAGGYLIAMLNGRPAAGTGPKMAAAPMPSVWTTYFAADDADAVAEAITAAGGMVLMPPLDVMDVGRMVIAADPAGAMFGIWQARAHKGAEIYNENGAWCWNDLHTPQYQVAKDFYGAVFGWSFTEVGRSPELPYATFANPGGGPIGGISDTTNHPGETPPSWLTWFQVASTDDVMAEAVNLGSTELMGPEDGPFGRMGILQAPQDEIFGVITLTARG
ncbi:VOC family protein [Nocardia crassostreae]|uniref:VOC family protein n=1 Tax=Nocardia crassostreae TaxID=53428 RepID=UPI000836F4E3|nr:VOC family protein [Nocardia crassostreae]